MLVMALSVIHLDVIHPLALAIGRGLPLLDRELATLALGKLAALGVVGKGAH